MKDGGFWYFFIAALAVKTPLAVLILAALGVGIVTSRYCMTGVIGKEQPRCIRTVVVMIVTMPSRIDTGVRYVMPVYVFISMLAAVAVVTCGIGSTGADVADSGNRLLGWTSISSAMAHPDYLAYFNEFGGEDPSRLLVVGDLDWGQDLTRLSSYLRENT